MGDSIKADLSQISLASRQVAGLAREFGQASQLADTPESVLGSSQVSSALQAFASTWSIRREQLIGDLDTLAAHTREAVDSYHGTDQSLASGLAKITENW
jgi:hypothetical protein